MNARSRKGGKTEHSSFLLSTTYRDQLHPLDTRKLSHNPVAIHPRSPATLATRNVLEKKFFGSRPYSVARERKERTESPLLQTLRNYVAIPDAKTRDKMNYYYKGYNNKYFGQKHMSFDDGAENN